MQVVFCENDKSDPDDGNMRDRLTEHGRDGGRNGKVQRPRDEDREVERMAWPEYPIRRIELAFDMAS